jgi:hypothetical protein
MSLFPGDNYQYQSPHDLRRLGEMEAFYAQAITIWQTYWAEADTDQRFLAGDQTLWNDMYGVVPINRRRMFNFNRIRPLHNSLVGYQRQNRKSTIVIPVENGDQETADQLSKVLLWNSRVEGMLETISDAFEGSTTTGLNLIEIWMDYREDPINGAIKYSNCAYNEFIMDPFFRKADLSDCNAIWKRTYLTRRECLSLFPAQKETIMSLQAEDYRDGKFQFMSENYNYSTKNLLSYDQYYYRTYRTQKLVVDTETGDTMEFRSEDTDKLKQFMLLYPQVEVLDQEIATVNLCIVVQGRVLWDGPQPSGADAYPFVPVFTYYYPQMPYAPWRCQGIVRGLRDAQFLYNRRKVIELDILESQISSGWKYKESALINPADIFLQGQGKGIALKSTAQMTDVEKIPAADIPQSNLAVSEALGKEMNYIAGISEEKLGMGADDIAGILSMLRQGAGQIAQEGVFDRLDFAQKLVGHRTLDLIMLNWTPGKIKKILEGEEPSNQFYNKFFAKYHCAVEEGINTSTQKQMQFSQMFALKQAGVAIPDDQFIEASTLQNKKKITDAIKATNDQQTEIQNLQNDMDLRDKEARIKLAEARAVADEGLGVERLSRVEENKALAQERKAAAVKDRDQALLTMVRTLKEIDTMDLMHIEKAIALVQQLKQQEANQEEFNTPQQSVAQSQGQAQTLGQQLEGVGA